MQDYGIPLGFKQPPMRCHEIPHPFQGLAFIFKVGNKNFTIAQ
jgi:hypothetical protein